MAIFFFRGAAIRDTQSRLVQRTAATIRSDGVGIPDMDAIAQAAGWDTDRVREAAAGSIEAGLVERTGDELSLTFPVFTSEDGSALLPTVDRVSERLAGEVDSVAGLVDVKFPDLGFGYLEEQFGTWRLWLRGNAAGEGLRVLYDRGILPHPGNPAPANFCMLAWFGQQGLFAHEK